MHDSTLDAQRRPPAVCPPWCCGDCWESRPTPRDPGLWAREHSAVLFDEPAIGRIELFRLDERIEPDGPLLVGPELVEVTSIGEDLCAGDAARLAGALLLAGFLVDSVGHRGGAR